MKSAFTLLAICAIAGCSYNRSAASSDPSQLRAEDIARSPGASIEELLAARVPGLMLSKAPDGRTVIHIRGADNGEPLFVVNGVPLGNSQNLAAINRYDIASVEVLRDAGSTAMWGIRGANGVILIRTKGS